MRILLLCFLGKRYTGKPLQAMLHYGLLKIVEQNAQAALAK